MASDLLAKISIEIDARLRELRPLAEEYERLVDAIDSLAGMNPSATAPQQTKTSRAKVAAKKAPERRGPGRPRGSASGVLSKAASKPAPSPKRAQKKRSSAPIGPVGQAVLDALDHGSHSVSELVMVTAMGASDIRSAIRRLVSDRKIVKVERDGKTAYALSSS